MRIFIEKEFDGTFLIVLGVECLWLNVKELPKLERLKHGLLYGHINAYNLNDFIELSKLHKKLLGIPLDIDLSPEL